MENSLSRTNIVAMLGLADLPDTERAKIVSELAEMVEERVLLRLADLLPKKKMNDFLSLIKLQNDDEISQFIEMNVPDFRKIIAEESLICKGELAKILDAVRAQEK